MLRLRNARLAWPSSGGRLRHLRHTGGLSPEVDRRLRNLRRWRPSALLRHVGLLWNNRWLWHALLAGPTANGRRLWHRRYAWSLPPEIGRRLRRLGLSGPSARDRLRYARLLWHPRLLRHSWMLRPNRLLRHSGLRGLAGPLALRRRSGWDHAEQADRLPAALRTTERLGRPLDLKPAVRTAECIHVLLLFDDQALRVHRAT